MKVDLNNGILKVDDKVVHSNLKYPQKVAIYFEDDNPRRYFADNVARFDNAVGYEVIGRGD